MLSTAAFLHSSSYADYMHNGQYEIYMVSLRLQLVSTADRLISGLLTLHRRGHSGLVLQVMSTLELNTAERSTIDVYKLSVDPVDFYRRYNWTSGYMIVRQFAVHLPSVIRKPITDRMHTMAVQGLQDAGLHMLDMMADRSPTLAIDILRYIANNNISLSRGTTEPSHIAGHPQFPDYNVAHRMAIATAVAELQMEADGE